MYIVYFVFVNDFDINFVILVLGIVGFVDVVKSVIVYFFE